jgi:glycosyltransferase involved in cell wall biosynthesis
VSTFAGDGGKSGVSQYIIRLLEEFPALAPNDTFDVLALENERDVFLNGNEDQMRAVCTHGQYQSAMTSLAWHQVGLPRLCAAEKYDALFIPAGNRRLPLWVPCPSVGTFHDLCVLHVPGKYDLMHNVYNLHVLPVLLRKLSLVITISESSKRDLMEYCKVPEERIIVTPEAADTDTYYPRDRQESHARISSKYALDAPYLLYISRIEHPGKNHVRLIRAFDRLKAKEDLPHKLVFAGSDWHRAEEVHREADQAAASDDIVFAGFVPNEDLPDLYCGADLFVFPSLYEGFGLPILEAMACGTPVACSNVSSMPEVAGDAGLLFDPSDEDSIEDSLRRALTDDALRDDYSARGLARSKEFSWKKTAEQTLTVLRRAAEVNS